MSPARGASELLARVLAVGALVRAAPVGLLRPLARRLRTSEGLLGPDLRSGRAVAELLEPALPHRREAGVGCGGGPGTLIARRGRLSVGKLTLLGVEQILVGVAPVIDAVQLILLGIRPRLGAIDNRLIAFGDRTGSDPVLGVAGVDLLLVLIEGVLCAVGDRLLAVHDSHLKVGDPLIGLEILA